MSVNLAQAEALVRLLRDARHPRTCPITGQFYTAEEYAELGEPCVGGFEVSVAQDGDPEMLHFNLRPAPLARWTYLHLDDGGRLWTWSTVRIPPEDCDCECPGGGPVGSKVDRSSCPVHGDSVRELECFRRASVGWRLTTERPIRWQFYVTEGAPIRDVLAEYRAERATANT